MGVEHFDTNEFYLTWWQIGKGIAPLILTAEREQSSKGRVHAFFYMEEKEELHENPSRR